MIQFGTDAEEALLQRGHGGAGQLHRTQPPSPGSAPAPPAAAMRRPPTVELPPHQSARHAEHHPLVEQQLPLVLLLLPHIELWPSATGWSVDRCAAQASQPTVNH